MVKFYGVCLILLGSSICLGHTAEQIYGLKVVTLAKVRANFYVSYSSNSSIKFIVSCGGRYFNLIIFVRIYRINFYSKSKIMEERIRFYLFKKVWNFGMKHRMKIKLLFTCSRGGLGKFLKK